MTDHLTAEELGQIVRARRTQLGRTQIGVVAKATESLGPGVISEPTYRAIEGGTTNASDRTLAAASVGLDWPADTLAQVRSGAPIPADLPDTGPPPWEELLSAQRETNRMLALLVAEVIPGEPQ